MKHSLCLSWILAILFVLASCTEKDVADSTVLTLTVEPSELTLPEGKDSILTAITNPRSTATIIWSTSNPEIATISETGLLKTIKEGTATITAELKNGQSKAECKVTVTKPVEPTAYPVEMNTIGMTQFDNSGENSDNFLMMIASGSVVFDEENFMYRTEDEGWVWLVSLFSAKVDDPATPKIPDGTYQLAEGTAPGTWNNEAGTNQLIYYSPKTGIRTVNPMAGAIRISSSANGYSLAANLDCEDNIKEYAISYQGEISFQGVETNNKVTEPVNASFIGGQAIYKGADSFFSEYGVIQLELYDSEPDPELGTVMGNMVKCKLYIELPQENFTLPTGTWELGFSAGPFVAEPGYDDGESIPTGSYIVQTSETNMLLGMLDAGTITITEGHHVIMDTYTADGVRIQGKLEKPLEIVDLGGGEVPSGPVSTLKEDKVLDLSGTKNAIFMDYGDYFKNGTRNVVLQILDGNNMRGVLLDLILPPAEKQFDPIPDCVCKINDGSNPANSFIPGSIMNNNAVGTWGFIKLVNSNGNTIVDFSEAGNAAGGTVSIKHEGENYTITIDFVDDAKTPHTMKCTWTGKLEPYSYNSPQTQKTAVYQTMFPFRMTK